MEATTSGEADFATAKKYLTRGLAQSWNPFARITVLAAGGRLNEDAGTGRKEGYTTVTLSGSRTATVDAKHAYQPGQGNFQTSIHLVRQNNEWRIDELQNGLVLSAQDFQRKYHSVNMYYFAELGRTWSAQGACRRRWSPTRSICATSSRTRWCHGLHAARGPHGLADPVVTPLRPPACGSPTRTPTTGSPSTTAAPQGAAGDANQFGGARCTDFAAQLYATVQAQASAKLAAVDVLRADGNTACALPSTQAKTYGPENRWFLDPAVLHRLRPAPAARADRGHDQGGAGVRGVRREQGASGAVAVRRDEQRPRAYGATGASWRSPRSSTTISSTPRWCPAP